MQIIMLRMEAGLQIISIFISLILCYQSVNGHPPPTQKCLLRSINLQTTQMKLKDLKLWLSKLSDEELEKELLYNSMDYGISGPVSEINRSEDNLYYVGDQPVLLHTEAELRQRGYSENQISNLDVEIPQGCYYIELSDEYSILERFAD
jgi:hypothetical protein